MNPDQDIPAFHSPLPWHAYEHYVPGDDRHEWLIQNKEPHPSPSWIAACSFRGDAGGKVNAELIVRAVNSHAKLTESLHKAINRLCETANYLRGLGHWLAGCNLAAASRASELPGATVRGHILIKESEAIQNHISALLDVVHECEDL